MHTSVVPHAHHGNVGVLNMNGNVMTQMTDSQLGQGWLFNQRFGYAYDKIPPGVAFEAYGKALIMCAAGDGKISEEERQWVVGFFAAFNSPTEIIRSLKTFDGKGDIIKTLSTGNTIASTPAAKRWLVWDALNTCAADGDLNEGELKRIRSMASAIGLEPRVVSEIEHLHNEQTNLRKKQFALLWPDGIPAEYRPGPGKPF